MSCHLHRHPNTALNAKENATEPTVIKSTLTGQPMITAELPIAQSFLWPFAIQQLELARPAGSLQQENVA